MASVAHRFSALARSQLRRQALTRGFRTATVNNASQAMTIPAVRPTVTEGTRGVVLAASIRHHHPTPKTPQHPSPSVMSLLKVNGLSKEDIGKIRGTGRKGRLLKGDILAYIGKIDKAAPGELSARIDKMAKLELSNIKVAPPKKPAAAAEKKADKKPAPAPPKEMELAFRVNFAEVSKAQEKMQKTLGVRVPLSTFITKATTAANAALPPPKLPPTQDELFNDILGLPNAPRKAKRGSFEPIISPLPGKRVQAVEVARARVDIFDVLTNSASAGIVTHKKVGGPKEGIMAAGENLFSLKVPVAEEERARAFLGRVKGLLEERPGELVL